MVIVEFAVDFAQGKGDRPVFVTSKQCIRVKNTFG
jgi:hypothetical protein